MIQSLAECWYVQCTKLSFFLSLFLNYAYVPLLLFSPSSHNFHEDRTPVEEWKRMANKVTQIYATRAHISFGPL